jgi:CRP/FNR family transcriptional regulator
MTLPASSHVELLRAVPMFASADPDDLTALAAVATEVDLPAGRMVVRQGDDGNGLFLVLEGRVNVVRDGETLATLGPGEWFGELAVLDRGPRVASVLADVPTRCLAIAAWDAERLFMERPALSYSVARELATRLRALTEDHRH